MHRASYNFLNVFSSSFMLTSQECSIVAISELVLLRPLYPAATDFKNDYDWVMNNSPTHHSHLPDEALLAFHCSIANYYDILFSFTNSGIYS